MARTKRTKPNKRTKRKKQVSCDISHFKVLKPRDVKLLYKITKQTLSILNQAKIDYWAEGGTLLGAMRTNPGGFIQWDDDVDLSIDTQQKPDLMKLRPTFKKQGLVMKRAGRYIKIMKPGNTRVWIDIFFLTVVNDDTYDAVYPQKQYQLYNYRKGELFPLVQRKFGKLKINVAKRANAYLDRCYPGWKHTAYLYNHHTKGKQKISFRECPELKKPVPDTN